MSQDEDLSVEMASHLRIPEAKPPTPGSSRRRRSSAGSRPSLGRTPKGSNSPRASRDSRSSQGSNRPELTYGIFKRLLVCLGLKSSMGSGYVKYIGYDYRALWALIGFLVFSGIFLTPQLFLSWINFPMANFSDLCESSDTKLAAFNETVRNMTNYYSAVSQVASAERIESLVASRAAVLEDWAEGCTFDDYKAAIAEAEGRTCTKTITQKVESCAWTSDWTTFFTGKKKRICVSKEVQFTQEYPCPLSTSLQTAAWQDYQIYQIKKMNRAPVVASIGQVTLSSPISEFISDTIWRCDIASDLYILYIIVVLLLGPPVIIYKDSLQSRLLSSSTGVKKPLWIFIIVLIWTTYTAISVLYTKWSFDLYVTNFLRDPCYVDPAYIAQERAVIQSACEDIANLYVEYQNATLSAQDIQATANSYFGCHGTASYYYVVVFSVTTDIDAYIASTPNFTGVCDTEALSDLASVATSDVDTNYVGILVATGLLTQILGKIFLTSFFYEVACFYEPLLPSRGKIEATYPEDLTIDQVMNIRRFQRDRRFLTLIGSIIGFLAFLISLIVVATGVDVDYLKEKYNAFRD